MTFLVMDAKQERLIQREKQRREEMERQNVRRDYARQGYCPSCLNFDILTKHKDWLFGDMCLLCRHSECRIESHPKCLYDSFYCEKCFEHKDLSSDKLRDSQFRHHLRCEKGRLDFIWKLQEEGQKMYRKQTFLSFRELRALKK